MRGRIRIHPMTFHPTLPPRDATMKTIALILFALSLAVSAAAGAAPLAAGKQRFLGSAHGPSQAQDFARYAVAQRYPDIDLLEVANATLPVHNQPDDRKSDSGNALRRKAPT